VINLSGDKDRVLQEAFDVVTRDGLPAQIRHTMLLWVGCIAGALRDQEYTDKLRRAGFQSISIEPTRIYQIEDARSFYQAKVSTWMRPPLKWRASS
jgi:hypothetical protein